MKELKAALFDFDGVLVNTEPLYDDFWNEAGERYNTGIPQFASVIKGTTMKNVMKKYFSDRPIEEQQQIQRESDEFEGAMPFPPVDGALEFVRLLKNHGVKIGLVTSSDDKKLIRAFKVMGIEGLFDTVVSAERIKKGKPDPMCYLLAAKDLGKAPADCIVFEDSFAGICSATNAGTKVVGLSTTNTEEDLKDKVYTVIPDFKGLSFEDYLSWQ